MIDQKDYDQLVINLAFHIYNIQETDLEELAIIVREAEDMSYRARRAKKIRLGGKCPVVHRLTRCWQSLDPKLKKQRIYSVLALYHHQYIMLFGVAAVRSPMTCCGMIKLRSLVR